MDNQQEALNCFNKAIEIEPKDFAIYNLKGFLLEEMN